MLMARNGLRNGHSVMVTFMNAGFPQDPNHLIHYAGKSAQFWNNRLSIMVAKLQILYLCSKSYRPDCMHND